MAEGPQPQAYIQRAIKVKSTRQQNKNGRMRKGELLTGIGESLESLLFLPNKHSICQILVVKSSKI